MIDLHMHSDVSDGSLSPTALAALVSECGLSAAALTDHDTMAGTTIFKAACARHGIMGIAGVEISTDYPPGTMHILGYFSVLPGVSFECLLTRIRDGRRERNHRILNTLERLGMPLDRSVLEADNGEHDVMGRPHIALEMVRCEYVTTPRMAFTRYLGKGAAAYHDRYRPAPCDAIAAIRSAGGAAVLAHPRTLNASTSVLRDLLALLKKAGLCGIEVLYPEHSDQLRQLYTTLAHEQDLVITGGSDFHGTLNPDIRPGRGFGNIKVENKVIEELSQKAGVNFYVERETGGVLC